MLFLVRQGQGVRLASYDRRLNEAAQELGLDLYLEGVNQA
jgi:hypothetical protein